MSTVQQVKLIQIDPDSSINVRRQGIEDNVDKVKVSIRQHGYWPDMPIVVRPHPNVSSGYDYEHVTGQCRFKACLELGLEEIPAFVFDLSDEQAIQRSWLENEARGALTYSAAPTGQKGFTSDTAATAIQHRKLWKRRLIISE